MPFIEKGPTEFPSTDAGAAFVGLTELERREAMTLDFGLGMRFQRPFDEETHLRGEE